MLSQKVRTWEQIQKSNLLEMLKKSFTSPQKITPKILWFSVTTLKYLNTKAVDKLLAINCFTEYAKQKETFPGGLEPPTFRLTAERANRLRHGDI